MSRLTMCLLIIGVSGGVVLSLVSRADDVQAIPTETPGDQIRSAMHDKLTFSQSILHGLVTKDFELIGKSATSLKKVSLETPQEIEGDSVDKELYMHFKLEFLRLTTKLEQSAKERNLDGAAFAYQNLTANCLACHSYLSKEKE